MSEASGPWIVIRYKVKCSKCSGSGKVPIGTFGLPLHGMPTEQDCSVCGATGKEVKEGELPITKFKDFLEHPEKAENLVDKEDEDSF